MPLTNITKETGDMAPDPKKGNLVKRVLSALIMLPIAIFIILYGGFAYFALVSLLTILILFEWNGIVEQKPFSALFVVEVICAFALLLSVAWGNAYIGLSFVCSIVAVFAAAYFVKAKVAWAIGGFLYALGPSVAFLLINENYGGVVVLWMMILIWSMDTGAYFVGKNVGGPKMSPKISPNKTWSGLIGGMITAMLAGSLYGYLLNLNDQNHALFENATILLILSGSLALLSQVGDLAESTVKRTFNVKDSGAIIPGHGGVMDRVDGVLFVAPAVLAVTYVLYG